MSSLVSLNPANGEAVGEVPITPADKVHTIVERAHAAQGDWRKTSLQQRAALLKQAGQQLIDQSTELGELLSREMGKPLARGQGEVMHCGNWILGKVDKMASALEAETFQDDSTESTLFHDPLGVAGVISPWNYPMSMPQWMVIPSLIAGNTAVLKPSEETPLIAQAYVDTLNAFLPVDVLQIIHGTDEQGKALVQSNIQFIAFTGSRIVGKHILAQAAKDLKRAVLELGGKDPLIVLDDADINAAAAYAVSSGFENAGQMCVSVERVYVDESVAEAFEQQVTKLARDIAVGPWDDPNADMGPMINARQRDHVIRQIKDAMAQGAVPLCGGAEHPAPYVLPTVLTQATDDMDIMCEETFGPVIAINRFNNIENAIHRANDNPYALGGAVFGRNEQRAWDVARQLEAGMIGVNKSTFGADDFPWIGAKESGYGFHGSKAGHRLFAQARLVSKTR
jgi:acyl-CoA reductase-like NAD-dependent aldehyde dehydrogenase